MSEPGYQGVSRAWRLRRYSVLRARLYKFIVRLLCGEHSVVEDGWGNEGKMERKWERIVFLPQMFGNRWKTCGIVSLEACGFGDFETCTVRSIQQLGFLDDDPGQGTR